MLQPRWSVLLLATVAACSGRASDSRPAVSYVSVKSQPVIDHMGDHGLSVTIELEVTAEMPHVAPHVTVLADCDGKIDKDKAFFMDLSNARPGDRKVDEVKLFEMANLPGPPQHCELTLSLTEGATPPTRFCYQNSATTAGACR